MPEVTKRDILHVSFPFRKGEIGPELIGKDLIRYQNFVDPVAIGVITDVKDTVVYATITDDDTINELLNNGGHSSLGMEIVYPLRFSKRLERLKKEGTDDEST